MTVELMTSRRHHWKELKNPACGLPAYRIGVKDKDEFTTGYLLGVKYTKDRPYEHLSSIEYRPRSASIVCTALLTRPAKSEGRETIRLVWAYHCPLPLTEADADFERSKINFIESVSVAEVEIERACGFGTLSQFRVACKALVKDMDNRLFKLSTSIATHKEYMKDVRNALVD